MTVILDERLQIPGRDYKFKAPRTPRTAMNCYALLAVTMPAILLPNPLAMVALFGQIVGVIWAYRLRADKNDAFIASHGRWMVRTIWKSLLLFFIGICLYGSILSANADHTAMDALSYAISTGSASPDEITALAQKFETDNAGLIIIATLACFLPPNIYAWARYLRGYLRARKSQSLENVKSWTV